MSIRNNNLGSITKPGFNALGAQTTITYTPLFVWGNSGLGLGPEGETFSTTPVQMGGTLSYQSWSNISAAGTGNDGDQFCAAIKTNGTLWMFGENFYGQLGIGTSGSTSSTNSPKQVGALTDWSQVSCGSDFTVAVKTDGTLWSWGNASGGVLGNNSSVLSKSSPVQVGVLTNWLKVDCGIEHVLAIKTDGTLWSWGTGTSGRLGGGNTSSRSSPVQVGALTDWSDIGSGYDHSIATRSDGTLWTWGANGDGQLGLGNTTNYSSPKQVGLLTTWSWVAAGGRIGENRAFAIKTDGTLWSWGSNNGGQLGLGNITDYSSPKQVGALTDWYAVSAGTKHTLATKTDGTLWGWGLNSGQQAGTIGNGTTTSRSSPVQAGTLTTWLNISAGTNVSIGIQS